MALKKVVLTDEREVSDTDSQTKLNTSLNATMSKKGKQLLQVMDELGFALNDDVDRNIRHSSQNKTGKKEENRLNHEESIYLLSVERGDCATVSAMLENAAELNININCADSLGRSAILIAIENEHIEILEVLLAANLQLGDAILHAIQEENVEAVEMILAAIADHPENYKNHVNVPSSSFTSDISPIILAAQRDNYRIIKILLDRGDRIPKPHDLQCSCGSCTEAQKDDSLRHSKSRINAYRALASPCLIALSSKDPILTAFELSWELKRLGSLENEFKEDYENLSLRCMNFAVDLLDQTRGSDELNVILNHDVGQSNSISPTTATASTQNGESSERMTLARLKLAIKYKQKRFVAHAHCQQLLASLWYEGLFGFRRKPFMYKIVMIFSFGAIFPFFSLFYLVAPKSQLGGIMRKPFIKFLCHSASYIFFLLLLVFAALRIEFMLGYAGDIRKRMKERGSKPTYVEWAICVYVLGFIWQEVKQLWSDGAKAYVTDMWNLLDFATNSLYTATITLRVVAYYRVQKRPDLHLIERAKWGAYDPTLISESLFATANIFSMLKLVNIFTVNPHLGPLQISLGRMLTDILKFCCVYILVLAAFASGLNQLLWFYARERTADCYNVTWESESTGRSLEKYQYCMTRGKYFTNLFEIVQSLYWATYGLIDLDNHNLEYNHTFTEFIGKTMFGAYSAIAFVVLLNMLIAMMNTSYKTIAEQSDIEWKFARSKLWVSYFDEGSTLPAPFNIIPSPKMFFYAFIWFKNHLCQCSLLTKRSKWQNIRNIVKRVNEKEARYQLVMQELVKRYLTHRQKSSDNQGVTEDDLNEIKGDISAFRFDLFEIFRINGMKTPENISNRSTKMRQHKSKRTRNLLFDDMVDLSGKERLFSTPFGAVNSSLLVGNAMIKQAKSDNHCNEKIEEEKCELETVFNADDDKPLHKPPSYQIAKLIPELTLNPNKLQPCLDTEVLKKSPCQTNEPCCTALPLDDSNYSSVENKRVSFKSVEKKGATAKTHRTSSQLTKLKHLKDKSAGETLSTFVREKKMKGSDVEEQRSDYV